MHMRTTLIIDDRLLEEAREYTGIREKTALMHEALKSLIAREAGRRLAALGGAMPNLNATPRRRSQAGS
jgi:Arc/MetJ family transcription regulator